jgi:hypothetical protein
VKIFQHVKEELSGNIAKAYVTQICRFHRIQGSTMFHEAAEYVKTELQKIGLKDVAIEQYPADGKTKYWTHTSPVGWTVNNAELRLLKPENKLICSYKDTPQCLHTFSNATPPEGVTAELVDVGKGTSPKDYKGKNVKGKLVLATGRAKPVHEQAVYRFGAAGVITDTITYEMPNVREALDIPDAHAYQAIWPTAEELPRVKFGFSLSKRQGNHLRAMLKEGKKVKLKATVDAKLFPFYEDVVTATIQGTQKPDQEIFLIAHLCHPQPSANDNASGSGLLLEIARSINTLIDQGKIKPPARTIRFLWVPETLGTVAYLAKHEKTRTKLVAGINLDMVGQNQELCKSTLNLDRTPDSLPSYLNDFIFSLVEQSIKEFDKETALGSASTFRYDTTTFSGGSDHAEFNQATTAAPCIMLLQWPDLYYHTSMDTADKVSEDSLKRVGWIATVATLTLANAEAETAYRLCSQTAAKAVSRLAEAATQATEALFQKKEDPKIKAKPDTLAKELAKTAQYHTSRLSHIISRECQAIESVKKLETSPELQNLARKHAKAITELGQKEIINLNETLDFIAKASNLKLPKKPDESKAEQELKKLIPRRLFKGSLSEEAFKNGIGEKEYAAYAKIGENDPAFGKKTAEILNFMNGKRTAHSIYEAVSAEYTPTDPEHVLKYLRNLEKAKLVALH